MLGPGVKKVLLVNLFGWTGRKYSRLGEDFIKWADEESIIKIILNTYDLLKAHIDPNAPGEKEHIGCYIVDRTGFEKLKKWVLRNISSLDIAEYIHQFTGKA